MPSYDYECVDCNAQKTVSIPYSEVSSAPSCDQCLRVMARKWTSIPIHFKGDGWGGSK